MSTTTEIPPSASQAAAATLTQAMAETSITDNNASPASSSPAPSEPKELRPQSDGDDGSDLEEGEIRDDDEEDDGRVKTVFDDSRRFNVKVGISDTALSERGPGHLACFLVEPVLLLEL